jgi:hypothetical protein
MRIKLLAFWATRQLENLAVMQGKAFRAISIRIEVAVWVKERHCGRHRE